MGDLEKFEDLLEKLIYHRDSSHQLLVNKYNKNSILAIFQERDEMRMFELKFKGYDVRGVDIIDFVKIFLDIIEHDETETLYIVIGLVDLFREICETFNLENFIRFTDIVNYVVENLIQSNSSNEHVISTRKIPEKKHFGEEQQRIREIDVNAPIIYGESFGSMKRLIAGKVISDRVNHVNNHVKKAVYASDIKRIFALDSLDNNIGVYDVDCKAIRRIYPSSLNENKDTMILDFTWSNKQNRLGCCLKASTLVFWDSADDFRFEKSFSIVNKAYDYQTNIWYIEFLNLWLTTDKSNEINVWDIQTETRISNLKSDRISSTILDIVPVDVLKLVAISCADKMVTLWNLSRKVIVLEVILSHGGVHSLAYSSTFNTLITAGYENVISLWNIDQSYFDHTKVGKLVGHATMVTAVQIIDKTPMLASTDNLGNVKLWDIRTLGCLQTVELGAKTIVHTIIDIYDSARLALIGSRINILEYEDITEFKNKLEATETLWPIRVEYNQSLNEIVVCTRKDIRLLDAQTGRIKKIYAGLLPNTQDDITVFKLVQHNKKFIVAGQHGHMGLYLYSTGELLKSLKSHHNEISSVRVDYVNKLIISAGWDSQILIQKETKAGFEIIRKVKNAHFRKEITIIEVSVYHNVIITASNTNILYIWDYEYLRLIGILEIEAAAEPSSIQFINGFSILIVGTNIGTVHFFHFKIRDTTNINMKHLAFIDIVENNRLMVERQTPVKDREQQTTSTITENLTLTFANHMLMDINYDLDEDCKPHSARIYIGLNKGNIIAFDIIELFTSYPEIKSVPHTNSRPNYNPDRVTNENFEDAIKNYKIYEFRVQKTYQSEDSTESSKKKQHPSNTRSSFLKKESAVVSLTHLNEEHQFQSSQSGILLNFSDRELSNFQAHKDILTTLSFIFCPEKKLLTSSIDGYFKIWEVDISGKLISSMNINHPLPLTWLFEINSAIRAKKQVLYGMKILETIFKRYEKKLTIAEDKKFNISCFLSTLENQEPLRSKDRSGEYSIQNSTPTMNLILMKDEYESRDIQYEKVKNMFQRELQGPSLKQMELIKKSMMSQKTWIETREQHKKLQTQIEEASNQALRDRADRSVALANYLIGDKNNALMTPANKEDATVRTKKLEKQLDHHILSLNKLELPQAPIPSKRRLRATTTSMDLKKERILDTIATSRAHEQFIRPKKDSEAEDLELQVASKKFKENFATFLSKDKSQPKEGLFMTAIDEPELKTIKTRNNSTKFRGSSTDRTNDQKGLTQEYLNAKPRFVPPLRLSALSIKKKAKEMNFFDYASVKNLAGSQEARSARSHVSAASTEASMQLTKNKYRKAELHCILQALEARRKKSQSMSSQITYETITTKFQSKEASTKYISQSDTSQKKTSKNRLPTLTSINKIPKLQLNFAEDIEAFKKNMDSMISTMRNESEQSIATKIAQETDKRWKEQGNRIDYETNREQKFVSLGQVFSSVGEFDKDKGWTHVENSNLILKKN